MTTPTPRVITNDELKSAALAAYCFGILTAQHPGGQCVYEQHLPSVPNTTLVCAIGAALTPEERSVLMKAEVGTVGEDGFALDQNVVRFEDLSFAVDVQEAHDSWVCKMRPQLRLAAESRFLELLA